MELEEPDLEYESLLLPYDDDNAEKVEASFNVIEAHPQAPSDYMARYDDEDICKEAVHFTIACRAITMAARGGQLKRLYHPQRVADYHFRLRALLPHWVLIEDWGRIHSSFVVSTSWSHAALLLRSFLSHASRRQDWLDPLSTSRLHIDRRLNLSDFGLLQAYFAPMGETDFHLRLNRLYEPVVKLYLPWLAQDGELAQQVLDVWHSVVDRGEADKVRYS